MALKTGVFQVGLAILTSDKVDFKSTLIKQDKEGHSTNKRGNTPKGNNNCQPICTHINAPNFIIL
jgi:hypothetical protein